MVFILVNPEIHFRVLEQEHLYLERKHRRPLALHVFDHKHLAFAFVILEISVVPDSPVFRTLVVGKLDRKSVV